MGSLDGAGWAAIGGFYLVEDIIRKRKNQIRSATIRDSIKSLTNEELEKEIRNKVLSANEDDFEEIWTRIEDFKRECPHLLRHFPKSYWGWVGKYRFIFPESLYMKRYEKKKLTKEDKKTIDMNQRWTITLLINTYGFHSNMEATRMVYESMGDSAGWTMEFG